MQVHREEGSKYDTAPRRTQEYPVYLLLSIATIGVAVLVGHFGGRAHAALLMRRLPQSDGGDRVVTAARH
jgi:hypothetical protein